MTTKTDIERQLEGAKAFLEANCYYVARLAEVPDIACLPPSLLQSGGYGKELVLDMHDCDPSLFTRGSIRSYFKQLCQMIEMRGEDQHFWDDYSLPLEERQTEPRLKGTTAIQFMLTSNITIHTLDILRSVYINIFSCKEFDMRRASDFTASFFRAGEMSSRVLDRI